MPPGPPRLAAALLVVLLVGLAGSLYLLVLAAASDAAPVPRPRPAPPDLEKFQGAWEWGAGYAWVVKGSLVALYEEGRPAGEWRLTLGADRGFTLDWAAGEGKGGKHRGRYTFLGDGLLLCSSFSPAADGGQAPLVCPGGPSLRLLRRPRR